MGPPLPLQPVLLFEPLLPDKLLFLQLQPSTTSVDYKRHATVCCLEVVGGAGCCQFDVSHMLSGIQQC
jgi:hypothetical protein